MRLVGVTAVVRSILAVFGSGSTTRSRPTVDRRPPARGSAGSGGRRASDVTSATSPGRTGPEATIEVPAAALARTRVEFDPRVDAEPDPGEVIWTWVPYEENDGRGKDRPVLIVARDTPRSVLALQLTSKPHDDDSRHFVFVGAGPWDSQGRPSWARLDRVFRVFESGMRREASSVNAAQFAAVSTALKDRRSS